MFFFYELVVTDGLLPCLQVHEKSILMPMLPLALLYVLEPAVSAAVLPLAAFSMFPLLERDGQALPYAALTACAAAVAPDLAAAWPALSAAALRHAASAPAEFDGRNTAPAVARDGSSDKSTGVCRGGRRDRSRLLGLLDRVAGGRGSRPFWLMFRGSCAIGCALHVARVVYEPPERIRFLHDLLMTVFAFVHFVVVMLYCNARQLSLPPDAT